jgi:hypothetical protein
MNVFLHAKNIPKLIKKNLLTIPVEVLPNPFPGTNSVEKEEAAAAIGVGCQRDDIRVAYFTVFVATLESILIIVEYL